MWPAEGSWEAAAYELFRYYPRIQVTYSEPGFAGFRAALERSGLTLREVTRVPHHEPEVIQ